MKNITNEKHPEYNRPEVPQLITLGGRKFEVTKNRVYLPIDEFSKVIAHELPEGIELAHYDNRYFIYEFFEGFESLLPDIMWIKDDLFRVRLGLQ